MKNYLKQIGKHKVAILHKMDDKRRVLQADKTFSFPSGSRMTVLPSGQVINPDRKRERRRISIG